MGGLGSRVSDAQSHCLKPARIPGEQPWVKGEDDLPHLNNLSLESKRLPPPVATKYPLPAKDGQYLGALIKVSISSSHESDLNAGVRRDILQARLDPPVRGHLVTVIDAECRA